MSSAEPMLRARSYLYAAGHDKQIADKALVAGADVVILDLEDAVADVEKNRARGTVAERLDVLPDERPQMHVRVNREGMGYSRADLDACVRPGLDGLRLPKTESARSLHAVDELVSRLEDERGLSPGHVRLFPTIESARGALAIPELVHATARVAQVAIGTTDLLADLGARGDDDLATLYIRSVLVTYSRAASIGPPIDSVHTDLQDDDGLRRGAERARALGFFGKSVIHPRQLATVHQVFSPSDEELATARRIIDAHNRAPGAQQLCGQFVDAAVVARARALLRQGSTHG